MLNRLNVPCAYIGTIGFYYKDVKRELNNTTPEIDTLYDMLIELYDLNCSGELNIIYYYQIYKYSIERITQVHNGIYNIINQLVYHLQISFLLFKTKN